MIRMTRFVSLSVAALGLSVVLVGCGGPDNEKKAMTNADGTPTKIESPTGPVPKTSEDGYKATNSTDPTKMPNYPKGGGK
jgi:cytochrome oxidase Cu insertion factor (SCO1/SenC/PrrC family)